MDYLVIVRLKASIWEEIWLIVIIRLHLKIKRNCQI